MGGPTEQQISTVFIPPGEGRQTFSPLPLAWQIENLEIGADGVLESIVGPSIMRIQKAPFGSGFDGPSASPGEFETRAIELDESVEVNFGFSPGEPFSLFSASLVNGSANMLLYRVGKRLWSFLGSGHSEVLIDDLSVNTTSTTMDQYVVVNDRVVFFNGVDRARIITSDGNVTPLGFDRQAATPAVSFPGQPGGADVNNYYPNSMQYSWQGRIGTPGAELSGQKGAVLDGSWNYYFQYEDLHGNLSEFSVASEPATIHTNQADPVVPIGIDKLNATLDSVVLRNNGVPLPPRHVPQGTTIHDLTRRFLVRSVGDIPEQAVATRIFRTPDTVHKDSTPRFIARVPGSRQFVYDDNKADAELGSPWRQVAPVPVFRVACSHQGRLIIGNVPGDPGIVRRSQPGFAGTFEMDEFIYPDSSGGEITGLASHNGNLIAFTENCTYLIGNDFQSPQPLSIGIGCVASKSIQSMKDGSLIWLGREGFYSLSVNGAVSKISDSLGKTFNQEFNKSQFFRAVSVVDRDTGEYRCALAPRGKMTNTIILCFDGQFWRRQALNIEVSDLCSLRDYTGYTLAIGTDIREKDMNSFSDVFTKSIVSDINDYSRVFVLGRQSTDYFAPPRRIRYRSAWLRSGEYGLIPTNVRNLYIGMLDSWVGSATVRLYRNGSWDPIFEVDDLLLCGPDDGSGVVADVASSAVLGEAKVRDPRLFWRQIPVDIQNANCWAFEIEILGSPNPTPPRARRLDREQLAWEALFSDSSEGVAEMNRRKNNSLLWELGRLKIAAFAFDLSIATKGSPTGRVPFRRDE